MISNLQGLNDKISTVALRTEQSEMKEIRNIYEKLERKKKCVFCVDEILNIQGVCFP